MKLVICDAHEGLKASIAKVLKASWQRCRVHFLGHVLAYAAKGQRKMVFALINTIFAQESADAAHAQWRVVVDQLRTKFAKLAAMRAGNCLSLVIMTAALAKEIGLAVRYQGVLGNAAWSRSGGMYFSNSHVNLTLGTLPQTGRLQDKQSAP